MKGHAQIWTAMIVVLILFIMIAFVRNCALDLCFAFNAVDAWNGRTQLEIVLN